MQIANVLVAIGGDMRNTVPKYDVTVSEVAVLREIHGNDAVKEIAITGDVRRTSRQEIGRLMERYGRTDGGRFVAPAVSALFPGVAARVFEAFDELDLDESYFAVRRASVAPVLTGKAEAVAREMDLSRLTKAELQAHAARIGCDLTGVTLKADIVEAIETHDLGLADAADAEDEDGVADMPDALYDGGDEAKPGSMFT